MISPTLRPSMIIKLNNDYAVLMFVVLCKTMNSSGWGTRDFSSDSTVHDYHILYLFIMTL